MASPADYMKTDDDDDDVAAVNSGAKLEEHVPVVEMPCEIVETTAGTAAAADQGVRQILMAPVHGIVKNDGGMLQLHAGHNNLQQQQQQNHHHHHHHHHNNHHHLHHQDLEDGQLTYVYESVVPQELYAEPESPGPSR